MKESGFYPSGAEFDPNAPYNQKDTDPSEEVFTFTEANADSDSLATVARVLNAMRTTTHFPCTLCSGEKEGDDIVLGARGLLMQFLISDYIQEEWKWENLESKWVDSYEIVLISPKKMTLKADVSFSAWGLEKR